MSTTKIEWTEKTWNPMHGCNKISPGCQNCYAQKMAHRLKAMNMQSYENGFDVELCENKLGEPLTWKKPSMIFVCSMGDLFHEDVPDVFIEAVFETMSKTPLHTYQILTKRPYRMRCFMRLRETLKNVWLGVTAENQEQADYRIPILLNTPAALRFVSVEPMLESIELGGYLCYSWRRGLTMGVYLDWVIVGGETGAGRRPMDVSWANRIKRDCVSAGVPFFFKKTGDPKVPTPENLNIKELPPVKWLRL